VPAFVAGRPATVTLPALTATFASDRVAASPRRTISTSSRRRTSARTGSAGTWSARRGWGAPH